MKNWNIKFKHRARYYNLPTVCFIWYHLISKLTEKMLLQVIEQHKSHINKCIEVVKKLLNEKSTIEKKEARQRCMQNRLRLGQFVTQRVGATFQENWTDGYAFQELTRYQHIMIHIACIFFPLVSLLSSIELLFFNYFCKPMKKGNNMKPKRLNYIHWFIWNEYLCNYCWVRVITFFYSILLSFACCLIKICYRKIIWIVVNQFPS